MGSELKSAKTVMGSLCGDSDYFEVGVGVHRGLALGPLLFVVVVGSLSEEFKVALPWGCVLV